MQDAIEMHMIGNAMTTDADECLDGETGVRPADPRREARLMRHLRFADCPHAVRADRRGRLAPPPTHVHTESVMAAL